MAVFLTGGAGSLGRAVLAAFLERGSDVVVVDLEHEAVQTAAAEAADGKAARAFGVACDITDVESIQAAWSSGEDELGQIDVVVNTAGVIKPTPIIELSVEQWRHTIDVNLTGLFLVCQHAARSWIPAQVEGAIVNVASTAAYSVTDTVEAIDYGASKAGVVGVTLHLAVHLGKYGIRANAIAPASFRSRMNEERLKDPEMLEKALKMVPLHRLADAGEVASSCVYLALDAPYVNGVLIPVDGGTAARM